MKKLTLNEKEEELVIMGLESLYSLELLPESDKEVIEILLLALRKWSESDDNGFAVCLECYYKK